MKRFEFAARLSLAAALAVAIGGCGVGRALGGKSSPDEFAIATKAPLVVPPDYALRPPRPGESRPQELSPAERARQVLLGDPTAAPPSAGEQFLIRKAGGLNADANIRGLLNAENGARGEKDGSFANQLIFWNFDGDDVDDSAAPLRVEDAEEWLADRQKRIRAVIGEDGEVVIEDSDGLSLPGVF
ncbi:MAG: DUF3035 domain-containing protein [Pseudomonadota bacterium]